ncbi:glycosyltransferase family 4 protein (plasmid) [Sphingomonas paucimobilis]|uniref:DNA, contig: SP662 n=1 Tax=Sphingomonas paucimobilis NBRC 13935 TaxID=1219050 RepID=A0A0C9MYI4_SPHPI|nr:glycosyltransferase family 1 protein [Sphingomonas paucimobilis]QPS18505.1 glycosyltransferase family 4 protein [Sphingomonas paucimobilis]GAN15676.1 putative glycosyltransferase [Sphingomonas paucimobilis NBRC 13935]SUK11987.1 glycosyltransferase, MSMEG_0565 family [Sphingomonas paucimobilis]
MTTGRTIYINGRFLTQTLSGVQRYANEIVRGLDQRVGAGRAANPYVLLTPQGARDAGLRHIEQRVVGRRGGHVWDQLEFAWAARAGAALCLGATGPVTLRRQLVVIHDAAVQRHPENFGKTYAWVHNTIDRLLARRAHLATVSQFSQRELAEVLRVPSQQIIVAKNGAEHLSITPDMKIVDRLHLENTPYFLILGNIAPNKNLAVAIRALAQLQPSPIRLVAVGRLDGSVFGHGHLPPKGPGLILPGRLDDAEVAGLMRSARALIFPSLYEGFGIPPLEAMTNDCPVLASTAQAVQETCGDAAEYFDPHDDRTLARWMQRAAEDEAWRAQRIAVGHAQLTRFSWITSADTLADAIEAIACGASHLPQSLLEDTGDRR